MKIQSVLSLTIVSVFALAPGASRAAEVIPANEEAATADVLRMIEHTVRADAAKEGKAHRDAHAKHHGCVKADFEVMAGLRPVLRQGLFAQAAKYPAWLRFSNGSGKSQNDKEGDGRGLAIKVMGVVGEKILNDEVATQDFLMINHPVFFVKDAADYVAFQKAAMEGNPLKFFFPSLNPFEWRGTELIIGKAIQSKPLANPLNSRYWSMTPYALGESEMKYAVLPCHTPVRGTEEENGADFLRDNLAGHLKQAPACFDFVVQVRNDDALQPIEDPRIEWKEDRAPFERVARVTIPQQEFRSKAQMDFCENLAYTPWHSLVEHRPLGGINRVRKDVYQGVSRLRHELNGVTPIEPTGEETFR